MLVISRRAFCARFNYSCAFAAFVLTFAFLLAAPTADAQAKRPARVKSAGKVRQAAPARERERKPVVVNRNGRRIVLTEENDLARTDKPDEALRFYLEKRLPAGMKDLPVERYDAARQAIRRMRRYSSADAREYPSKNEAPGMREIPRTAGAKEPDTILLEAGGATGGVLGTWQPLGPGNVGGRTRALIINPTDPNIMYTAGVAGGVWKTTNGGASWTALDDFMANIAVTTLAFDPSNPSVIYAGTGEGFFNADAIRGAGIFKTTDAGTTWTRLSSTTTADFFFVNDIVVSNVNPLNVYAATRSGVMRSLDGGASWTLVLASNAANGTNGAMDLAIRTDRATDYIFASVGTFAQAHIFRNTDAAGSGTWTDVYTEATMARTSLAIAPSNQDIVYGLAASTTNNGMLAVLRSNSAGDTGTWVSQVRSTSTNKQDTLLLSNPVNGVLVECNFATTNNVLTQGWYDNVIAVDPTNPERVWAGGVDVFRSDNGGVNWGVASYWWFQANGTPPANGDPQLVHADNHAIVFHPGFNGTTNQTMFIGNDGGIYKTSNAAAGNVGYAGGTTAGGGAVTPTSPICGNPFGGGVTTTVPDPVVWTPLNNGYAVTQFYHGAVYPDGATYFGGTQDNGTNRGTDAAGANAWSRINGGDGGYVAVDPTNTNVLYLETTGLSLRKSTDGGLSFLSAVSGISGDAFPFITTFRMDPSNPSRLWIGGRYLWRTDNAAGTWTRTSASQQTGGSIGAIAISPSDSNLVINGAASGQLRRTTTATSTNASTVLATSWLQSFTPRGNGNGSISWLEYDPSNSNVVWATISTFNGTANGSGTNAGHVYRSADGGATWALADGTQTAGNVNAIPDIPAHSVAVDPSDSQRVYVGTDLGVFVTLDGGANWFQETTGFSNTPVESLQIVTNGGVRSLYAFTHGRGAFKVTIPVSCATVSPTTLTIGNGAYNGVITVTKNAGASATCSWNAVSNSPFITITSSSLAIPVGADSGTVSYAVAVNPSAVLRTGQMTIAGRQVSITQATPTAADASITGRIVNASGTGIRGAVLTLIGTNGEKYTARTNSFGYYRFDAVESGAVYTLVPTAKGYTFSPESRVFDLTDSLGDVDFSAVSAGRR